MKMIDVHDSATCDADNGGQCQACIDTLTTSVGMTTMSGIHNSDTCTADHGQPCRECGRVQERDSELLRQRPTCATCGNKLLLDVEQRIWVCLRADADNTGAHTVMQVAYVNTPDPFPLLSPPLRSLSEAAGNETKRQPLPEPDAQTTAWKAANDEWDVADVGHRPVPPELLELGRVLFIDPFDNEWTTADERFTRDRTAAFYWWLTGRGSNAREAAELLGMDAEEIGRLLEERMR